MAKNSKPQHAKITTLDQLIRLMLSENFVVRHTHVYNGDRTADVYHPADADSVISIPIALHHKLRDLVDIEDVRFAVHYMQTPQCEASWVYADIGNKEVAQFVVEPPKKPTWDQIRQNPEYARAYRKAPSTTLEMARKLRVGDIIEVTFEDCNEPQQQVVIGRCDKNEDHACVRTMTEDQWDSPVRNMRRDNALNSDKFVVIGHVDFLSLKCAVSAN